MGTHDWQRRELYFMPQKPIKSVWYHVVFRNHAGKASFKGAELYTVEPPGGACSRRDQRAAAGGTRGLAVFGGGKTSPARHEARQGQREPAQSVWLRSLGTRASSASGRPSSAITAAIPRRTAASIQSVELRQTKPEPLFAVGYSKAEGVKGLATTNTRSFWTSSTPTARSTLDQFFCVRRGDARLAAPRSLLHAAEADQRGLVPPPFSATTAGKAWFRLPELYKVRPPEGNALVAVNRPEPVTLVESDFSELPALPTSVTALGQTGHLAWRSWIS